VEFAGDFAATVGLDWKMWLLSVLLGSIRFFTLDTPTTILTVSLCTRIS
jgi:hypothetical protein